jgi:hypothetical protein
MLMVVRNSGWLKEIADGSVCATVEILVNPNNNPHM